MKAYKFIYTVALLAIAQVAVAQDCSTKKLGNVERRGQYDYHGQSTYSTMLAGDSLSLSAVLYSNKNYRIFVAAEESVGEMYYKVFVTKKKTTRVIKEIRQKDLYVYKTDTLGYYDFDPDGQRIFIDRQVVPDTIWTRQTTTVVEQVFDSRHTSKQFYEITPERTQIVLVKSYSLSRDGQGCVGMFVGRKQ